MEKRHQLETFEGHGRLVWDDRSLPVRHDVTVNQYAEAGADGREQPTYRSIEARIETDDQQALSLANGRDDLVLQLEDGRRFPCILREAQGGSGWLIGIGEMSSA